MQQQHDLMPVRPIFDALLLLLVLLLLLDSSPRAAAKRVTARADGELSESTTAVAGAGGAGDDDALGEDGDSIGTRIPPLEQEQEQEQQQQRQQQQRRRPRGNLSHTAAYRSGCFLHTSTKRFPAAVAPANHVLDDELGYVYFEVPKAASTAIRYLLQKNLPTTDGSRLQQGGWRLTKEQLGFFKFTVRSN